MSVEDGFILLFFFVILPLTVAVINRLNRR